MVKKVEEKKRLSDIQRDRIAMAVARADGFQDSDWNKRTQHWKNLYYKLVDASIEEYEKINAELGKTDA